MRHKKILSKKRVIALVAAGIMIATTLAAPLMAHADTMEYSLADVKKEATDLESQINNFLVEKEAVESLLDVYCAALVDLNKYMDGESKDSENLSNQIIKLNAKIGEADNKMRATPVGSSEEALYKKAIDVYKNSLEEVEILKETLPLIATNPQMYESMKNSFTAGCYMSKVVNSEYNDYFRSLEYLKTAYSKWVENHNTTSAFEFTCIGKNDESYLLFQGHAYEYEKNDFTKLEKNGVQTEIKVYTAVVPGEGNVRFYYDTNNSLVIEMGTASVPEGTYFEDSEEDAIADEPYYEPNYRKRTTTIIEKMEDTLKGEEASIKAINEQTEDITKQIGKTIVESDTDSLKAIKAQIASIIVTHDQLKASYEKIKARVYNENITKEELKRADLEGYIKQLNEEKASLLALKTEINEINEGDETLTNDSKIALLNIDYSIDNIIEGIDKDIKMFEILKATGSTSGDVVSAVTGLITQNDKLEQEAKKLESSDASIKAKELENKIKELSLKNSSASSKLSGLYDKNNNTTSKINDLTKDNANLSKSTLATKALSSAADETSSNKATNLANLKSKSEIIKEEALKEKENGTINQTSDKAKVSNPITSGVYENYSLADDMAIPMSSDIFGATNVNTYDTNSEASDVEEFDFGAVTEEGASELDISSEKAEDIEATQGSVTKSKTLPIILIISGVGLLIIGGAAIYIFKFNKSDEDFMDEYDEDDILSYSEDKKEEEEEEPKLSGETDYDLMMSGDFSDDEEIDLDGPILMATNS